MSMYGFDFDASRLPASSYTGGPPPRERWRPPRKLIATVAAVALAWGIYANPSDENSESALDDIASSSFEAGAGCAGAIADMVSGKDSDKLRGCSNDPKSPLSLNIYGETIPSTNYKVPKEKVVFVAQDGNDKNPGTKDQPLGSINAALERSPEKGGTVVIRGGMYRQGNARTGKSVTIQNYPKEQVWLDGTDSIPKEQWRQDSEGKYYIDWSTPDFCGGDYYDQPLKAQRQDNKGPCAHKDMSLEADNTMAVDPQMAYKNGINLPEVERYDQATGDNFYYDHGNRRVVLGFNPGKAKMEVTKRASALILAGPGSVVRGIGVQRYATNEYYGNLTNTAVYMAGRDSTIENMVFRKMAGQALYISPKGGTVNHSVLASNGFNGMGSNGSMNGDQSVDGLKVLNSAIFNNNTENFGEKKCTLSCAQSGIKIAHVNQFLIQNNILLGNNGYAFWIDNYGLDGTILGNLVIGNSRGGILDEISKRTMIVSNMLIANGKNALRSCSQGSIISNNTIVRTKAEAEAWVYEDPRTKGKEGGVRIGPDSSENIYTNNTTIGSLPSIRLSGVSTEGGNNPPERMFKRYDGNAYYRDGGAKQPLLKFESPSRRETITTHDTMQAVMKVGGQALDANGVELDTNPLVSEKRGDYRIKSGPANNSSVKLEPEVAKLLGVKPDAKIDRGALFWPGM